MLWMELDRQAPVPGLLDKLLLNDKHIQVILDPTLSHDLLHVVIPLILPCKYGTGPHWFLLSGEDRFRMIFSKCKYSCDTPGVSFA